jgi:hypothetical protein
MPLLIIIFGLFAPRVILVLAWCGGIFTGVWHTLLWPVLGLIFMPYTTLAYGLAYRYGSGLQGFWLALFIIGIALDLGATGGSTRRRRRRTLAE